MDLKYGIFCTWGSSSVAARETREESFGDLFIAVFCSLYKIGINILSINTIYTANFEQEFPPPETSCEICTVFCLSCKN